MSVGDVRRISPLQATGVNGIRYFMHLLQALGFERQEVRALAEIAHQTIRYLRSDGDGRLAVESLQRLERKWYAALLSGTPDYSVYAERDYLAEVWACWDVYSSKYLHLISTKNSLPPNGIAGGIKPRLVVDLGCGLGITSAELRRIFPEARVIATNLPGTIQWRAADLLSKTFDFSLTSSLLEIGEIDLVFASEYFEHFQNPIEHLLEILTALRPRRLLLANSFTQKAIGHFDSYQISEGIADGRRTSKLFGSVLRERGYVKVKTRCWNGRPAYWIARGEVP